jgi:hypothetical protein
MIFLFLYRGRGKVNWYQPHYGVKFMGISKYLFVAALSCCAFGSLHAVSEALRHPKKHYLDEKAINVTKDGIVVETKKGSIRVKTLRSDSTGIYVYQQDVIRMKEKGRRYDRDEEVYCYDCHRTFSSSYRYQQHLPCPYRR